MVSDIPYFVFGRYVHNMYTQSHHHHHHNHNNNNDNNDNNNNNNALKSLLTTNTFSIATMLIGSSIQCHYYNNYGASVGQVAGYMFYLHFPELIFINYSIMQVTKQRICK